jgi:hypothetical protein
MKITNQANGMKSIFKTPIIALVAIVAAFTFTFMGCKQPFDGLKLVADGGKLVSPPSMFYVLDAETGLPDPAFENITVTITGPNADNVYASGGSKNIKIVRGLIQTSFSMIPPIDSNGTGRVQNITEAAPWKYNIVINVPGYRQMVYPVIATNPYPTVHEINLLKESSFIIINFINNTIGTSDNNGKIISRANTNDANLVDFNLSPGQILTDESGSPMSGSVLLKGNYSYYGSGTSFNKIYMQNFNMTENTIQDKNGVILPETNIFPLLSYNLNATVNGKEVYKIAPNSATDTNLTSYFDFQFYYNVETKQNFKAGDSVTLISKRNGSNIWVKEKNIVVNDNNTLTIKIFATHPGTYALVKLSKPTYVNLLLDKGQAEPKSFLSFNATVDYLKPDGSVFFTKKLRVTEDVSNKSNLTIKAPFLPLPFKLRNITYKYDYNETGVTIIGSPFQGVLTFNGTTNPVTTSNITLTMDLRNSFKDPNFRTRGECSSGAANYVVLPLFYTTYFIESAKAATTPLYQWQTSEANLNVDGTWNLSYINSDNLEVGQEYTVLVIYNNKEYTVKYTWDGTAGTIEKVFTGLPCGGR